MKREEAFNILMDTIYELSRACYGYQNKPRKYGTEDELFMVEVHLLNMIGESDKINVTRISKKTNRTKGAVSQIIDKLVNKELVLKYKNPYNNREIKLELTEKGKKVFAYHKLLDKEKNDKILLELSDFTISDLNKYIKITNTLRNHM